MTSNSYHLSFFRRYISHLGGRMLGPEEQKAFAIDLVDDFNLNFEYAELIASVTPIQETRISLNDCTIFTLFNPDTIKQESAFLSENVPSTHQWLILGRNRKGRITGKWDESLSKLFCGAIDLSSIDYGNIVSNQLKLLAQSMKKPYPYNRSPQVNPLPVYDYLEMISSFNPDSKTPYFECHGDASHVDKCKKSWKGARNKLLQL